MRYLVTGISGFVGRHFVEHLARAGVEVHGVSRAPFRDVRVAAVHESDLGDVDGIVQLLERARPDRIVHLAAASSVGRSWSDPVGSFTNNVGIFLNLAEAMRISSSSARLLSVGSSEQYGVVAASELPIDEAAAQNPESPYAIGRVSQELLARMYRSSYGLDVVMTRSFNHIGPGQDRRFVVPSFAGRLLDARDAQGSREVVTGDLSIVRDFLDVRDIVRAYDLLLEKGVSGEAYNVCSGTGTSLRTVFESCARHVGIDAAQRTDPELVRPNEIPEVTGSFAKLEEATGWRPEIDLDDTIGAIVAGMTATR